MENINRNDLVSFRDVLRKTADNIDEVLAFMGSNGAGLSLTAPQGPKPNRLTEAGKEAIILARQRRSKKETQIRAALDKLPDNISSRVNPVELTREALRELKAKPEPTAAEVLEVVKELAKGGKVMAMKKKAVH